MVSEGRGNPKLVVNIEISKERDLRKRKKGQNMFHFESQIAKEFTIVRGVRGEIDSTAFRWLHNLPFFSPVLLTN
ncbi:hypothetical protein E2C01_050042 [Portunus trituberculatus]|uniref:Uncharacterized protein n=1 Tax=Portunus trituberculatus TaxID=210409 RepID=A0A5B7G777_PORTR|nr:hypothetical protein [Portunus trituberculatus]